MLARLLPRKLKDFLRTQVRQLINENLPELLAEQMPFRNIFFPHAPQCRCYLIPKAPEADGPTDKAGLPIPPNDLWLGYGTTAEEYLAVGEGDVQTMRETVGRAGAPLESAGRILELGCAAGRMIRWLHDLAGTCEVWGADVSATHVLWCQQHLSPPFHFVTTTTWPHLPFEDRYFGFIYAGSVFTHIDDLADAWFLELRRVLRPGGRLYITIHDRNTIAGLDREHEHPVALGLRSDPAYERFRRSDFGMFTIGRHVQSQVFYDVAFLRRKLDPFFRTLAVVEEAYWHQTALLLERV